MIKRGNGCLSEHHLASRCRYLIQASSPHVRGPLNLSLKMSSPLCTGNSRITLGVEEQQITDDELAAHLDKHHIAAFDSLEELK